MEDVIQKPLSVCCAPKGNACSDSDSSYLHFGTFKLLGEVDFHSHNLAELDVIGVTKLNYRPLLAFGSFSF